MEVQRDGRENNVMHENMREVNKTGSSSVRYESEIDIIDGRKVMRWNTTSPKTERIISPRHLWDLTSTDEHAIFIQVAGADIPWSLSGLARKESMPAFLQLSSFSRLTFAVSAMIGNLPCIVPLLSSSRILRVAAKPSRMGISPSLGCLRHFNHEMSITQKPG